MGLGFIPNQSLTGLKKSTVVVKGGASGVTTGDHRQESGDYRWVFTTGLVELYLRRPSGRGALKQ